MCQEIYTRFITIRGHGFDSRWCHWNFSLIQFFLLHYGPGVESASSKNEYQEYFLGGKGGRCVRLTTLPPSCADCHKIWEPQPPETLRACQACKGIALLLRSYQYVNWLTSFWRDSHTLGNDHKKKHVCMRFLSFHICVNEIRNT